MVAGAVATLVGCATPLAPTDDDTCATRNALVDAHVATVCPLVLLGCAGLSTIWTLPDGRHQVKITDSPGPLYYTVEDWPKRWCH